MGSAFLGGSSWHQLSWPVFQGWGEVWWQVYPSMHMLSLACSTTIGLLDAWQWRDWGTWIKGHEVMPFPLNRRITCNMWLNKKRLLQPLGCFGGQDDDNRIWWYFWWNSNRSQLTSRLPEPGTPGPRSGHAAAASAIPHLDGYKGLRGLEFDRHVPSIEGSVYARRFQSSCTQCTPVDGPMGFRPAFPRRKWRLHSSSLWRGRCCGPRSGFQGSRGSRGSRIQFYYHEIPWLSPNPIKSHEIHVFVDG